MTSREIVEKFANQRPVEDVDDILQAYNEFKTWCDEQKLGRPTFGVFHRTIESRIAGSGV